MLVEPGLGNFLGRLNHIVLVAPNIIRFLISKQSGCSAAFPPDEPRLVDLIRRDVRCLAGKDSTAKCLIVSLFDLGLLWAGERLAAEGVACSLIERLLLGRRILLNSFRVFIFVAEDVGVLVGGASGASCAGFVLKVGAACVRYLLGLRVIRFVVERAALDCVGVASVAQIVIDHILFIMTQKVSAILSLLEQSCLRHLVPLFRFV